MKAEERQIQALFLTGVAEWFFKFVCIYFFNYNPLWIKMMGALGTGMILYSIMLSIVLLKSKEGI